MIDAFLKNEPAITDRNVIRYILHHLNKYLELPNALIFNMVMPKYVSGLETYCDDLYNEIYPLLPSYYRLSDNMKSSDVNVHLIIQYYKPKNPKREV